MLTVLLLVTGRLCAQPDSVDGARIEFVSTLYDFGTVNCGTDCRGFFEFTNTGNEQLVLTDVRGSCMCIAHKIPNKPILPGESARINFRLDSHSTVGPLIKPLVVVSNAVNEPALFLRIKAVPDGTYTYRLVYTSAETTTYKELTGHVNVLR